MPYDIFVPSHEVEAVFDLHGGKPSALSWQAFIAHALDELGGFILEGYFDRMMKLNGENTRRCMRVLATVDEVIKADDGIRLSGRVEEWCPEKYS